MKCLHIVSGDLWAGAETATTALLAELRTRKNVEPAALLLNDGRMAEELKRSGVSVSVAREASTGMLALGRTVRAAALALGAEIVHSHRYKEHLLGAWAVAGRRIAHVRTAHGLPPAIGLSGRGLAALADAARCRAGGARWIAVSDDEILEAMRLLGRTEGVFGEPAGVTATAGVKKAVETGLIRADESVTVISTGSGLKDVKNAMLAAGEPFKCDPDIRALEASGRIH